MHGGALVPNQANTISFVLLNDEGNEAIGVGTGFAMLIAKANAAFVPSTGTKAEIGNGWYRYTFTAAECSVRGTLSVAILGGDLTQQNLEYVVDQRNTGAVQYTYTVTSSAVPVSGARVWVSTDALGANLVESGTTDALGTVKFWLDAGVYFFWKYRPGFNFSPNPEQVSVS